MRTRGTTWPRAIRDLLCRIGMHWPVRWEGRPGEAHEELLCQRPDCRYRLARRPGRAALAEGDAG